MLGTSSRDFLPHSERSGLGLLGKWGQTLAPHRPSQGPFPRRRLHHGWDRVLRGSVAGGGPSRRSLAEGPVTWGQQGRPTLTEEASAGACTLVLQGVAPVQQGKGKEGAKRRRPGNPGPATAPSTHVGILPLPPVSSLPGRPG